MDHDPVHNRRYRRVASSDWRAAGTRRRGHTWLDTICSAVSTRCDVPSWRSSSPRFPPSAGARRRRPRRHPPRALAADPDQRAGSHDAGPALGSPRRLRTGHLLGRGRGRGQPADRAGRAGPQGRRRGLRTALRPLQRQRLPVPLLPGRLGAARRGPHRGDVLPGTALDELVPVAGQGLRRLADDHRAQPDHRPLQGRPHPPGVHHRGHDHASTPPRTARRTRCSPR